MILNLLILLHFFGDFYTQSDYVSKLKKKSSKGLLLHVCIYTLPFILLGMLMVPLKSVFIFIVILFTTHLLIDYFKIRYERNNVISYRIFLVDQASHLIVIFFLYFTVIQSSINLNSIIRLVENIGVFGDFERTSKILVIFAIIYKPISYLIEIIITPLNSKENDGTIKKAEGNQEKNFGSLIGTLERITIVLLGLLNLWSSIAIVITAKSIARFKQLEDKDFAQKYLIGTLLSLSMTLLLLYIYSI
ncbi:MAG: DUF3307 domain-containing protein [Erysipelotrichaceae bacterium]|nr:DUF3307 domain-containing protein [Erysipelotrichaceae bacterium]